MSELSRHQAQQEADRLNAFRRQWEQLEGDGILALSAEQKQTLNSYIDSKLESYRRQFDIDTTASAKQLSWGLRIASTLGGFSLCVALVLLFQYYWGSLSTAAQVGIVILAPLAALAATEYAAQKEKTLYFAALLSMVAIACFVMNLAVLGETFNFTSTHGAFLAWSVFSFALAYHYGLRVPLVAGIIAMLSWLSAQVTAMRGYHWMAFGERPEHFLLGGLAVFALPLIVTHKRHTDFAVVYRCIGMASCYLATLALLTSGHWSYLPWADRTIETFYEIFGLTSAALAVWFGIRRSWMSVVYISASFFTLFLYIRLFRWWWDWLPHYAMFFVVGVIAIAIMYLLKRLRAVIVEVPA